MPALMEQFRQERLSIAGEVAKLSQEVQAFGGFYPPNPPLGAWRRPQTPRALVFRWDAYTQLLIHL